MLCISLWQPWASLWACGLKVHETRDWAVPPKFAGKTILGATIAIHAAKRLERFAFEETSDYFQELLEARLGAGWARKLPRGAIVGTGRLVACWKTEHRRRQIDKVEEQLGDWHAGRYAWQLADAQPLASPVPWRGQQGWFEIPDDALTLPAAVNGQAVLL